VVAGRQGRLFGREDVYLLELLGAQAVVAIVHSNLLEEQQELNRQVEYARSQLETVLSSTESPVVAVDRDYRLIFANPAARALFPVRDDLPLVGQIPPDALPTRQLFRDIRRSRAHTYELALGDTFYLCHLAPLGYPPRRISGWVAVLNDVTQLKELDRMKSEMVRMTSHDLKNPLQAAMANLELLQDELTDADIHNSEIDDSITQIDKQLSRMNRIIRGILDLERVKIGARNFDYCPPAQIVDRAFDEMAALATDRRIQLVADVPPDLPALACDPDQFERAIINLVENAIKFSPSGASVGVRVRAENGTLVFQVEDSGVGIAEELQPRVFDRFYRANQKGTEHVTGSGLGLSLVKTIVENHHGKVTLTSQMGVGTTFTVTVPLTAVKN
ncbi:MAG: HAMP domain-containing histidine kinase, partial [Anaerolineae bacterium]|nr:HAMP domain-containing histidine kinase [Anaerolineae bacterium]